MKFPENISERTNVSYIHSASNSTKGCIMPMRIKTHLGTIYAYSKLNYKSVFRTVSEHYAHENKDTFRHYLTCKNLPFSL